MARETMEDRVRDPGQGIIVAFPTHELSANGKSIPTLKGYFFKVTVAEDFYMLYDHYAGTAAAGSTDYDYLGDSGIGSGNDVLRIENDDFHLTHFGVGLESTAMRVFESVSPSSPNSALDRDNFVNSPDPTAASAPDYDYYTGAMQDDKYDPPAHTERVSFRNDKAGKFLQFGFYSEKATNTGNLSDMHLVGRGYKLAPVTDTATQDTMMSEAILDPEEPEIGTVLTQVGGLRQFGLGSHRPDQWDDNHARVLNYGLSESRV